MPKHTKKPPSKSPDRSKEHPYPNEPEPKNPLKLSEGEKEWDEARCVICMEPPHNPLILVCTSHENGCRPYICHTSALLSNCLSLFRRQSPSSAGLSCPLCRGRIEREELKTKAFGYMNSRPRSCAREDCDFCGTYAELIEHARSVHAGTSNDVAGSKETRPVFEGGDEVVGPNGTTAVSSGRRTARMRVGYYPRRQLARRDIFT